MGRKKNKPLTAWEIAKPLLEADYLAGEITDDMPPSIVIKKRPEYEKVPSKNFGANWRAMKARVAGHKQRALDDENMAISKDKPLHSGVPPWHSILIVSALFTLSIATLPSSEAVDAIVTIDTFTTRLLPDLISLRTLATIRSLIALSIWSVTFHMSLISKGWELNPHYIKKSKLKNTPFKLSGLKTLCPFTSLSWILLGSSFSINAIIAFQVALGKEHLIQPWVLRCALILWELCAPFAILVSSVVRYGIWPIVLKSGKPHALGNFRNQMQHNANSIYALTEMALLGGLPIKLSHISLPCLVGCTYILFTWANCRCYGNQPEDGPQYLYWFMDPTLGRTTSIALVTLVGVLCLSFGIFVGIKSLVTMIDGTFLTHVLCVVLVASVLIRTRD